MNYNLLECKFNNGLLICYGKITTAGGTKQFPISYTNYAAVSVDGYIVNGYFVVLSHTLTEFTWSYGMQGATTFSQGTYIAIGY